MKRKDQKELIVKLRQLEKEKPEWLVAFWPTLRRNGLNSPILLLVGVRANQISRTHQSLRLIPRFDTDIPRYNISVYSQVTKDEEEEIIEAIYRLTQGASYNSTLLDEENVWGEKDSTYLFEFN